MPHRSNPDRRRFERIPMDCQVRIHSGAESRTEQLIDISLRGLLLTASAGWQPCVGQRVDLSVRLDDSEHFLIALVGEIRHVEDTLIGVHLLETDIDSGTNLRRLVELNLGDPDRLDRELQAMIEDSEHTSATRASATGSEFGH